MVKLQKEDLRTDKLTFICNLEDDDCSASFTVSYIDTKVSAGYVFLYNDGGIIANVEMGLLLEAYNTVSAYALANGLTPHLFID